MTRLHGLFLPICEPLDVNQMMLGDEDFSMFVTDSSLVTLDFYRVLDGVRLVQQVDSRHINRLSPAPGSQ